LTDLQTNGLLHSGKGQHEHSSQWFISTPYTTSPYTTTPYTSSHYTTSHYTTSHYTLAPYTTAPYTTLHNSYINFTVCFRSFVLHKEVQQKFEK
jgi:hypothetical protein